MIPSKQDILNAYNCVKPFVHRTPVLSSSAINELAGTSILFKCEKFQKMGAFKMRGAVNTDAEAIAAQKTRGDYAQNIRDAQADETSVGNYPTEPFIKPNIKGRFGNNRSFKSGGRAKLKSGGKVKGCGKALRGFGRAMKKGKK